jgi:hypothetical protein
MLISQRLDPTPKLQVECHENFLPFTNRVEHSKMEDSREVTETMRGTSRDGLHTVGKLGCMHMRGLKRATLQPGQHVWKGLQWKKSIR